MCDGLDPPGEMIVYKGHAACKYTDTLPGARSYTAFLRTVNSLGKEDIGPSTFTWNYVVCTRGGHVW